MPEYRTILVPTDFSPHSERGLEHAIYLAKETGSAVHLVLAYAHPIPPSPPGAVLIPNDFWGTDRDGAERRLEEAFESVKAARLKGAPHLVDDYPEQAIVTLAQRLSADLIVMGTRGRTGLAHVLLGSVAERTLRLAPCPVLMVRAPNSDGAFDRLPPRARNDEYGAS